MKKVLLLATVAIAFVFSTNAQIRKGSILLGGSVGFTTSSYKNLNTESSSNSVLLSPQFGYTFKENNVAGLRLTYNSNNNQHQNYPESESSGYSAGLFYRRYISLSNKFFLFGEGGADYGVNNYNNGSGSEFEGKTIGLNLFPGISYAVGKRFQLEAVLNDLLRVSYSTGKNIDNTGTSPVESKTNAFSIGTNLSSQMPLTIGFRFVLGK
ncbi:MAG TPA: hypothetical protein VGD33_00995 [Chitinophagaceae bacterium]